MIPIEGEPAATCAPELTIRFLTQELPSVPVIVNNKAIKKHTKLIVTHDVELATITEKINAAKTKELAEGQKATKIAKKTK